MRRFNELGAELSAENRALAETLRALFFLLGESLNAYSDHAFCDKGTMSLYLAGKRIPPWRWIFDLRRDVLQKSTGEEGVAAESTLRDLYDAALKASPSPHRRSEYLQRKVDQTEELLHATQQQKEQQKEQQEEQQPPRPEPECPPDPPPVPWRLEQISAETEHGLHMERLPEIIRELQALGHHAEAYELLGVAARRPVPQALHALHWLEKEGLVEEADFVVALASARPPRDAADLAETLLRNENHNNGHLLKNFLSGLSLREPRTVAETAEELARRDRARGDGRMLWWELLNAAGNRPVKDMSDVMAAMDERGLGREGVRAVFSGDCCRTRDRCSKVARLLRLLQDEGCMWQQKTVVGEVVRPRIAIDQVVGTVNALHEVKLPRLAEELGPQAVRARGEEKWRDKLVRSLLRAGLAAEAESVRQTLLA
ncbi:hypothetical protein [Streptomyces phaeochromogenes]